MIDVGISITNNYTRTIRIHISVLSTTIPDSCVLSRNRSTR